LKSAVGEIQPQTCCFRVGVVANILAEYEQFGRGRHRIIKSLSQSDGLNSQASPLK
jgi:hypothetical protein